jgi:phosphatidylglycerol:prolipoprotein diacylglycerol transferase
MKNGITPFLLSDMVAIVTPIGLFFGRLANFINGELWGRPTDVAWAMIFPRCRPPCRVIPSQLYQAFFEASCCSRCWSSPGNGPTAGAGLAC